MQTDWKPDERTAWQLVAQAAVIVGAVLLVYLPAWRAGFVWDDEQLITANPLLRTFSGLIEMWSGGRTADYFPMTNTGFWIERHLFCENATGYHAINILLHGADAILVWLGFDPVPNSGALVGGVSFPGHPLPLGSGG